MDNREFEKVSDREINRNFNKYVSSEFSKNKNKQGGLHMLVVEKGHASFKSHSSA